MAIPQGKKTNLDLLETAKTDEVVGHCPCGQMQGPMKCTEALQEWIYPGTFAKLEAFSTYG